MGGLILRDYQEEALQSIPESGRYLIQMATGLGKTVTFSRIQRRGRMLILAHREELLEQPEEYFTCSYGIEQAAKKSNGEDVVAASIQSLHRRLKRFSPDEFDIIIIDEAHRAASATYRKIVKHFNPRLLLGFTATPNRSDNVSLSDVFDKIIFERDLEWGIRNGYLCDIHCLRVDIGFDLSNIKTRLGDFDNKELEKEMLEGETVKAVAESYEKYAKGQTVIFACSIKHAENIAEQIPGAMCVTGKTKNRKQLLNDFKNNKIKCLVNCLVMIEGTNLPCIETIIMARPTKSTLLYTQSIGRGTRLYQGKEKLILIDCVGVAGRHNLCTAPSLLGLDMSTVHNPDKIDGDLFDLPEKIEIGSDVPESWIKNVKHVALFARERSYKLHDVNYFKMPDGSLVVQLPERRWLKVTPINKLGFASVISYDGKHKDNMKAQDCFDFVYKVLNALYGNCTPLWNLSSAKRWGSADASEKQVKLINRRLPSFNTSTLTKLEAGQILNRLFFKG